jgi:hypothetical protein
LPLYAYPAENVSIEVPAFTTTIYRFNLNGSQCYTVSSNPNNIIYVSNDGGYLNSMVRTGTSSAPENFLTSMRKPADILCCETFIGIKQRRGSYTDFKRILLPPSVFIKPQSKTFKNRNDCNYLQASLYLASGKKLN